jgi:hypothetical protein
MLYRRRQVKGMFMRKILFVSVVLVVFAAGCDSKKASTGNFKNALQTYYDKNPACLIKDSPTKSNWFTQVEGSLTFEKDKVAAAEALKNAGFLTSRDEVITEGWAHHYRHYETIPGHPACFAHYSVKSIDNFTEPAADAQGRTVSEVNYTYTVDRVEDWSKNSAIQVAIPFLKGISVGMSEKYKVSFMLTNNGWEVIPGTWQAVKP